MGAVFVDSSVWIDHLRGTANAGTRALRLLVDALDPDTGADDPDEIVVGDLVLVEVLRGIADDRHFAAMRSAMLAFRIVELGGAGNSLAAVDHCRALRLRGITVRKTVDCLIAAWCIGHRVTLLHGDRDFEPFAAHCGLRVLRERSA